MPENVPEFLPLPMYTIEGKLNKIYFYQDTKTGEKYLKLVRHDNSPVKEIIEVNCRQWGYDVSQMTERDESARAEFGKKAESQHLRVLQSVTQSDGSLLIPYVENAMTYDDYMVGASQADAEYVVRELFDDLIAAHSNGIVYGDRWPKNILVDDKRRLFNIDFDLELGKEGKELELAQMILYTLALGRDNPMNPTACRLLPVLRSELEKIPEDMYARDRIVHYVMTRFKNAPHYANARPFGEELFKSLKWVQ